MKKILLLSILVFQSICYGVSDDYIITTKLVDAIALSEELNKEVLVIFTANWCDYCNQMKKDLEYCQELEGMIVCFVNIDKNPELKQEYKVRSIPDYFLLKDKIEIKRQKGYYGKKDFLKWLSK
jgi:thioredoxin-related protein